MFLALWEDIELLQFGGNLLSESPGDWWIMMQR
jgi:hypothetical protein